MHKVEFEADIIGRCVTIPAHLLTHISSNQPVKVIIILPDEENIPNKQCTIIKSDLLEIGKRCANLPLLDSRSADEILQYDQTGLPS